MGDLSPVLAAFLEGQRGQTTLLQHANQIINEQKQRELQKQQLNEMLRQHTTENALSQKRIDMEAALHADTYKLALFKEAQAVKEKALAGFLNGEPLQGKMMPIPGLEDTGLGATEFQANPTQTIEGPSGPIEIPTAEIQTHQMAQQQHINDLLSQIPALTKQTEAIEGVKHKFGLENIELKQQYMNELAAEKNRNALDIATRHNATSLEIQQAKNEAAQAKSEAEIYKNLRNWGIDPGDPHGFSEAVANQRKLVTLGKANITNDAVGKTVKRQMDAAGEIAPPGGTKFGDDISTITAGSERLVNDFEALNRKYPALGSVGRQFNRLQNIPMLDTEAKQFFKTFESNIAPYATKTGETPSMMRSVMLAKKAEGAMPTLSDAKSVREVKRMKLDDLTLDKLQEKIGTLSKDKRIEVWKDAIDRMPHFTKPPYGAMYKEVLEDILETGTYHPNLLIK